MHPLISSYHSGNLIYVNKRILLTMSLSFYTRKYSRIEKSKNFSDERELIQTLSVLILFSSSHLWKFEDGFRTSSFITQNFLIRHLLHSKAGNIKSWSDRNKPDRLLISSNFCFKSIKRDDVWFNIFSSTHPPAGKFQIAYWQSKVTWAQVSSTIIFCPRDYVAHRISNLRITQQSFDYKFFLMLFYSDLAIHVWCIFT